MIRGEDKEKVSGALFENALRVFRPKPSSLHA